jgi:aspartate-semialdehyde dehydrogenase
MEEDVPLVVPEVNPHAIKQHKGIIANPNCSTIQMVLPLKAIMKSTSLKRIVVSTYQSVSGGGQQNILELEEQVRKLSRKESHYGIGEHTVNEDLIKSFKHQIAYNAIPHIDVFLEDNYTKEEKKMVDETRKILEIKDLPVTATCVRVPVYYAHSESVNLETERKVSREEAISLMRDFPGIKVFDDPARNEYPMPVTTEGTDEVFVGRIREDLSVENGLNMWVVADNLRKGAALNAVQIAEELIRNAE